MDGARFGEVAEREEAHPVARARLLVLSVGGSYSVAFGLAIPWTVASQQSRPPFCQIRLSDRISGCGSRRTPSKSTGAVVGFLLGEAHAFVLFVLAAVPPV